MKTQHATRTFAFGTVALALVSALGLGTSPLAFANVDQTPPPLESTAPPKDPPADPAESPSNEPQLPEEGMASSAATATSNGEAAQREYLPGGTSTEPVTVRWAGSNDEVIQQYQPMRSDQGSEEGHHADFANLQVTVSQTANLGNQMIGVKVAGMNPTVTSRDPTGIGQVASNYVQVMQCWGADPLAEDFATTCQYGGFESGTPAYRLTAIGAAFQVLDRGALSDYPATDSYGANTSEGFGGEPGVLQGMPFRTPYGDESVPSLQPSGTGDTVAIDGLGEFFNAQTSNEAPITRIGPDGSASLEFELQNAAAAPQLGCGRDEGTGARCWLVIVPRGTHWGGRDDGMSCYFDPGLLGKMPVAGESVRFQIGSPISPACSYWDHRIVVGLDFAPAFASCPPGAPEQRIVGSELAIAAISSWQPALCNATPGASSFGYSTNSGQLNRDQLVQGKAGMILTPFPLTSDTVGDTSADLLETLDIRYAPVMTTGLVLGFVASKGDEVFTDIKLTPRLVAKLLTQQYASDIPHIVAKPRLDRPANDTAGTVHGPEGDPEWLALGNPSIMPSDTTLVVMGARGDDAIGLLWQWIQADEAAAAWLAGEPDNQRPGDEGNLGLTVNAYYLPAGHPRALGGGLPYALATAPTDTFPRADQTVYPQSNAADNGFRGLQIDSVNLLPYAGSFEEVATRIRRADTQTKDEWDPNKYIAVGTIGTFVAKAPVPMGFDHRLLIGPTSAESQRRYGLSAAALQLPNRRGTFVAPTDAAISAAQEETTAVDATGVATVDFAALGDDAYPLTTTIYAAVDFNAAKVTTDMRLDYSAFLRYAVGDGQRPGQLRGQLPSGYVPLTESQRAQALYLAGMLDGTIVDVAETPRQNGTVSSNVSAPGGTVPTTTVRTTSSSQGTEQITALSSFSLGQGVLGGALITGVVGLAATPVLMRRRFL